MSIQARRKTHCALFVHAGKCIFAAFDIDNADMQRCGLSANTQSCSPKMQEYSKRTFCFTTGSGPGMTCSGQAFQLCTHLQR